jgi:hypothetical protein
LASQPTLSRFANAINIKSLKRLRDVFLDQFIASLGLATRASTSGGAAAFIRGLLVSSGDLAASALGRGQSGGQRSGKQPTIRGNQPAGSHGPAGADV